MDCSVEPCALVCDDADRNGAAEHRIERRAFLRIAGALVALPVVFGDSIRAAGSEYRYAIPAADGVTIDRKAQIIVVRYQQHLYAFNLACPHENTALKWLPKDGRFQCPKHESRYQPSGQFIDGRATRNMDRLGVRVESDMLVVDTSKFYKSDKNPAGWAAATVAL
ncbi:MAG TPA: Rieske (2Fe-2S) protein [Vicinamibacterales bacterium]|nr:Rieske (2Fe-2S) protein [Vicinamibacterales bacterium]